jgi:hypothetical protein
MNIDRHNYEEYFLLYIDNELSVDQKKQVEVFVQQNPDLEEELVMLKQSRLIPDDSIVFNKKHLLMKEENASHPSNHSFINLNNYEQWLIMYVDDELSAEEKLTVERFALAHEHVQQELDLFQQTKLQTEEIVFPDKEILYRREKTVRVISIQWWRVAVAAVLVIAAGITLYSIFNKNGNKGITPDGIAKKEQVPASRNTTSPTKQEQTPPVKEETEQKTATIAADKELNKEKEQQEQPKEEIKQQLAYNPEQPNDKNKRIRPTAVGINEGTTEQPKMTDAVAIDEKMHKENINTDPVTKAIVETPDKSSTSDDAVQYASNAENKKFRGFFRKATRLIERTTNINTADDDKVLIGGMAINLK